MTNQPPRALRQETEPDIRESFDPRDNYLQWQRQEQKRRRRLLTAVLIALILILLAACGLIYLLFKPDADVKPADTNGVSWIRSIYGFGNESDQLHHPADVAVAPGGDSFWVADTSNFRLIEYYMNGSLKQVVTHDSEGTNFNSPNHIAVAPDGWIYVAEQTYNHILVFDPNFKLMQTIGVEMPMSITVNENILVVGSRAGFGAYQRDGSFLGKVGTWGNGSDQFDIISALVLDSDDNVYVLDSYNNRLSRYDESGDKIWMVNLGYPGNAGIDGGRDTTQDELTESYPGNMQLPMGLTLDSAGRCVIIDLFDFSVAAFDSNDGSFLKKWGTYGRQDGFFDYPSALTYNRVQDAFISAEPSLGRVQIFALDGSTNNPLSPLVRNWGDLLKACCLPLLIITVIAALYTLFRHLARRKQKEAEQKEAAEEQLLSSDETSSSLSRQGGETYERDELPEQPLQT